MKFMTQVFHVCPLTCEKYGYRHGFASPQMAFPRIWNNSLFVLARSDNHTNYKIVIFFTNWKWVGSHSWIALLFGAFYVENIVIITLGPGSNHILFDCTHKKYSPCMATTCVLEAGFPLRFIEHLVFTLLDANLTTLHCIECIPSTLGEFQSYGGWIGFLCCVDWIQCARVCCDVGFLCACHEELEQVWLIFPRQPWIAAFKPHYRLHSPVTTRCVSIP